MVASINKMTIRITKSHTAHLLCGLLAATVLSALIQPSGAMQQLSEDKFASKFQDHMERISSDEGRRRLWSLFGNGSSSHTTSNSYTSWFTKKLPDCVKTPNGGLYLDEDGKYMTYVNGKLVRKHFVNPAQSIKPVPYRVEVKGAGSKKLNGLYYRKECKEGPPKGWGDDAQFYNFKGWLTKSGSWMKLLNKTAPGLCVDDWCEYVGLGMDFMSAYSSTVEEKKKAHKEKNSETWCRMSGGRQYYEKADGCSLFFTTKPDSNWDAELKQIVPAYSNESAKWRLADKSGKVYYTADCKDGNINVAETNLCINPTKRGWKINDYSHDWSLDKTQRGLSPCPAVHF